MNERASEAATSASPFDWRIALHFPAKQAVLFALLFEAIVGVNLIVPLLFGASFGVVLGPSVLFYAACSYVLISKVLRFRKQLALERRWNAGAFFCPGCRSSLSNRPDLSTDCVNCGANVMASIRQRRSTLFPYCLDKNFETIGMVELLAELRTGLTQTARAPRPLLFIVLGAFGITLFLAIMQAMLFGEHFSNEVRLMIVLSMFFVGLNGVIWYAVSRYDSYYREILTKRFKNRDIAANERIS